MFKHFTLVDVGLVGELLHVTSLLATIKVSIQPQNEQKKVEKNSGRIFCAPGFAADVQNIS